MRRTHGNNAAQRTFSCMPFLRADGGTASSSPQCRWSALLDRPTNSQREASRRHSRHASCTNRDSTSQDQHKRHQRVSEGHTTSEVQAVVHTRASRAHLARSGKRIRFAGRTHHSMEVRQSPTMNKLYNTMPPRTAVSLCLQVYTAMHRRRTSRIGEPKTTRRSSPPTTGCIQHDNQSARATHKDASPLNAAHSSDRPARMCLVAASNTRCSFSARRHSSEGAHM